jgi:hypothetical protein
MRIFKCRQARRAFTLVELVTAASLMTVMMVGVVEIFGIVAQTAGEAEGVHFAQQQMRAFFNRLHSDIRGMTREGYLSVQKGLIHGARGRGSTQYAFQAQAANPPIRTYPETYGADTLAFVTIGTSRNQMGGQPTEANAAEVVYTNQVRTDGHEILRVDGVDTNPRRGVLCRGLFLLGGSTASGGPYSGTSAQGYLCRLFAEENSKILGQQSGRGATAVPEPDIMTSGSPAADGAIHVDPWVSDRGAVAGTNPESLNRVMACCVSEFYVEAFVPTSMNSEYWHGEESPKPTYRWASSYESQGDPLQYQSRDAIESWPPAIRVTVAVHDPGEGGDIPEGQDRYRGYAMQEIFWLGDP